MTLLPGHSASQLLRVGVKEEVHLSIRNLRSLSQDGGRIYVARVTACGEYAAPASPEVPAEGGQAPRPCPMTMNAFICNGMLGEA
ncbi:hypothetical protein WOLCODRAFT_157243 [Wolfiporia cocos MD-104 SS10]|uniref:Uncharacterized protein n=1 Tax=Wolfiporia cocos (strain MD-104) TaxID=742152 RepID=A0A2H3J2Z1_WOLCO|nr:hypothetical protein WOLCODRAFT_157243 [Wolfiporia cocos MD-104 SS10]